MVSAGCSVPSPASNNIEGGQHMTDVLTSIQRILDKPDDEDCDGLLRDALRLSLLQHPDMEEDDQDTLYD
jgi:hypothetical protein